MKISIITICYNNLQGLIQTAQSIAAQTIQDFEWIVVDGASSDGTIQYLQNSERKPDILISEPDKGIYDAMNKGMVAAHGEYQLYLNSGDYLYNNTIIEQVLSSPMNADVVYGDLEFVSEKIKPIGIVNYPHDINALFLLYSSLGHPASFIKAERLKEIGGYDSTLKIVSDWKIWLEFYLRGFSFQHCNFCISSFVIGGISSTHTQLIIEERKKTLDMLFYSQEQKRLIPKVSVIIPYPYNSIEAKETEANLHTQYYPNWEIGSYSDRQNVCYSSKYVLTITKEDSKNQEFIARKIEKLEYAEQADCVVGIPVYKPDLTNDEGKSLQQCFRVLKNQKIILIAPNCLDTTNYDKAVGCTIDVYRFGNQFFKGIQGYNNLLLSNDFYQKFKQYEYLLIYQLDAWVFYDALKEWCQKDYDYIGAPCFEECKWHEDGKITWSVGNGGLSLRKTSCFINITSPHTKAISSKYFIIHELLRLLHPKDILLRLFGKKGNNTESVIKKWKEMRMNEDNNFYYVSNGTQHSLKRASPKEVAQFAIETSPQYYFQENGYKLPFGCHAWKKWDFDIFWKYYIMA